MTFYLRWSPSLYVLINFIYRIVLNFSIHPLFQKVQLYNDQDIFISSYSTNLPHLPRLKYNCRLVYFYLIFIIFAYKKKLFRGFFFCLRVPARRYNSCRGGDAHYNIEIPKFMAMFNSIWFFLNYTSSSLKCFLNSHSFCFSRILQNITKIIYHWFPFFLLTIWLKKLVWAFFPISKEMENFCF